MIIDPEEALWEAAEDVVATKTASHAVIKAGYKKRHGTTYGYSLAKKILDQLEKLKIIQRPILKKVLDYFHIYPQSDKFNQLLEYKVIADKQKLAKIRRRHFHNTF